MSDARVYLAVLPCAPAALLRGEDLDPSAVAAHAVTAALRAALPDAEEEELEYEALWEAAAECAQRVLVAAVDLPAAQVAWTGDELRPSAVRCAAPIRGDAVVSWHVALASDDADAELSWYDASELHEVARLAGA